MKTKRKEITKEVNQPKSPMQSPTGIEGNSLLVFSDIIFST